MGCVTGKCKEGNAIFMHLQLLDRKFLLCKPSLDAMYKVVLNLQSHRQSSSYFFFLFFFTFNLFFQNFEIAVTHL